MDPMYSVFAAAIAALFGALALEWRDGKTYQRQQLERKEAELKDTRTEAAAAAREAAQHARESDQRLADLAAVTGDILRIVSELPRRRDDWLPAEHDPKRGQRP